MSNCFHVFVELGTELMTVQFNEEIIWNQTTSLVFGKIYKNANVHFFNAYCSRRDILSIVAEECCKAHSFLKTLIMQTVML